MMLVESGRWVACLVVQLNIELPAPQPLSRDSTDTATDATRPQTQTHLQRYSQLLVAAVVVADRVQVVPQAAAEQQRRLRHDGKLPAQLGQAEGFGVGPKNGDAPAGDGGQPQQGGEDRRLAGAWRLV
jgi:hypothetical protein